MYDSVIKMTESKLLQLEVSHICRIDGWPTYEANYTSARGFETKVCGPRLSRSAGARHHERELGGRFWAYLLVVLVSLGCTGRVLRSAVAACLARAVAL